MMNEEELEGNLEKKPRENCENPRGKLAETHVKLHDQDQQ
jgi:hypothetical protein